MGVGARNPGRRGAGGVEEAPDASMRGNVIEIVIGAVVLIVAALFLAFAYRTSQFRAASGGYEVSADFARIDGIHQGSDVRISGIKVGTVVADALDPKTYLATIRMSIDKDVQLPDDTVAQVTSSGLLGDKYMSLAPGGSDKMIPPGGKIQYTQSSISLENLIGQMMFSTPGAKPTAGSGADGGGATSPGAEAAAPSPAPLAPSPAAPR
jgi:phospholipid/cholesterol/gamma-HCH transport system substrate-binding protein